MADDDFDRELEQAASEARGETPAAKPAAEPTPAAADEATAKPAEESPAEAHAMTAKKPGAVDRAKERLGEQVARYGRPRLTVRNVLWGLLVVVLAALMVENWAVVRFNFFGAYVDLPKPIAFLIDVLIGMLIMWYFGTRKPSPPVEGGEASE